jgi:Fe-S-cluster containining protein
MDKAEKEPRTEQAIIEAVERIYSSLETELLQTPGKCKACGKCCDFESFGHKLYITTPELTYFKTKLAKNKISILPMTTGVCPYRKDGKCSVYPWRFAGCRIFNCTGNADLQGELSEKMIRQMKQICLQESLSYRYLDLRTALNQAAVE